MPVMSRKRRLCRTAKAHDGLARGTPLPKGHGRLIDADMLKHEISEWLKPAKPDEAIMVALDDIVVSTMMEIEDAPTIIEADNGGE